MNQELKERLNKISLTHYLKITGKWRRKKATVWIESIYHDLLIENHIKISDLINELLEKYLRDHEYLDITEYIDIEKIK